MALTTFFNNVKVIQSGNHNFFGINLGQDAEQEGATEALTQRIILCVMLTLNS